ncbi:uncharacterized protein LOC132875110 [Neoarius graeffei]|uniref:uncharacterized protein LOC132875110 n=1 Tax=Neoarius graeffei TaxID=443677 RepID=UPI00298C276D|nr:uncharacterized protein LOC132875110 [Neoarius graeffei]
MAESLCVFTLQLLLGVITLSLLQIISADHISVDPGQNITLLCNITHYSEISWYQKNSTVRQIISAKQKRLDKKFYVDYNVQKGHFDITEINSSVSLVIISVRETDLGFYYCKGKNSTTHTEFGKPIRLNFTVNDANKEIGPLSEGSDLQQPERNGTSWIPNMIVMCVCSISVLINIICMCVFCSRVHGKSGSSCGCYEHTTDYLITEKEVDLSDLTSVTYTSVS